MLWSFTTPTYDTNQLIKYPTNKRHYLLIYFFLTSQNIIPFCFYTHYLVEVITLLSPKIDKIFLSIIIFSLFNSLPER